MQKIVVKVDSEIQELIPEFIENRHHDVTALRQFVLDRDFQSIKILGHSMKGFGAGYGFLEISTIGEKLELSSELGDIDRIINLIDALADYLQQIEIVYESR